MQSQRDQPAGSAGGLQAGIYRTDRSPMHAMIAMRAAAARAALADTTQGPPTPPADPPPADPAG